MGKDFSNFLHPSPQTSSVGGAISLPFSIVFWLSGLAKFNIVFFFSVAGAMGICFPYLGEFQQTKYREKILCWMEMFWTLGVILLPCKNIKFYKVIINTMFQNLILIALNNLARYWKQYLQFQRNLILRLCLRLCLSLLTRNTRPLYLNWLRNKVLLFLYFVRFKL